MASQLNVPEETIMQMVNEAADLNENVDVKKFRESYKRVLEQMQPKQENQPEEEEELIRKLQERGLPLEEIMDIVEQCDYHGRVDMDKFRRYCNEILATDDVQAYNPEDEPQDDDDSHAAMEVEIQDAMDNLGLSEDEWNQLIEEVDVEGEVDMEQLVVRLRQMRKEQGK